MRNWIQLSLLFTFFSCLASLAYANEPATVNSKIAIMDMQYIHANSTAIKGMREQLEKKRQQYQQEISKKQEALHKEEQELASRRNLLATDAFEQKAKEFREKVENMQRDVHVRKRQLEQAYGKALIKVNAELTVITDQIAKDKSIDLVLPASQILFYNKDMNISMLVLEQLNKRLPKVTVVVDTDAKIDDKPKKK